MEAGLGAAAMTGKETSMKWYPAGLLLIGLLLGADKPAVPDQKAIQGTWSLVGKEIDGAKVSDKAVQDSRVTLTLQSNRAVLKSKGKFVSGDAFRLDPTKNPRQIICNFKDGKHVVGIYVLEGDTLKICRATGKAIPKGFETAKGEECWLLSRDRFKPVARGALDVTSGQVGEKDGYLTITHAQVRAQEQARTARASRLVFTYHGPTEQVSKLASGEVRHQIGLKLRTKNTCNLLYVMWRLDDKEFIAVAVKRNPGQSTHQECGDRGYMSIQPAFQETAGNFPSAKDGKPHTLEADVTKPDASKYELVVKADGKVVWRGLIEAKLLNDIDGPAGFRTDNARCTFKFYSLMP
jgi:uncharacterized protein (TIGR03067 family)